MITKFVEAESGKELAEKINQWTEYYLSVDSKCRFDIQTHVTSAAFARTFSAFVIVFTNQAAQQDPKVAG